MYVCITVMYAYVCGSLQWAIVRTFIVVVKTLVRFIFANSFKEVIFVLNICFEDFSYSYFISAPSTNLDNLALSVSLMFVYIHMYVY